MSWCLSLRWTKDYQTIMDPYMGAGSTGVAAINAGRKFVGIELSVDYFDIACRRIEAAAAQGSLFNQAGVANG